MSALFAAAARGSTSAGVFPVVAAIARWTRPPPAWTNSCRASYGTTTPPSTAGAGAALAAASPTKGAVAIKPVSAAHCSSRAGAVAASAAAFLGNSVSKNPQSTGIYVVEAAAGQLRSVLIADELLYGTAFQQPQQPTSVAASCSASASSHACEGLSSGRLVSRDTDAAEAAGTSAVAAVATAVRQAWEASSIEVRVQQQHFGFVYEPNLNFRIGSTRGSAKSYQQPNGICSVGCSSLNRIERRVAASSADSIISGEELLLLLSVRRPLPDSITASSGSATTTPNAAQRHQQQCLDDLLAAVTRGPLSRSVSYLLYMHPSAFYKYTLPCFLHGGASYVEGTAEPSQPDAKGALASAQGDTLEVQCLDSEKPKDKALLLQLQQQLQWARQYVDTFEEHLAIHIASAAPLRASLTEENGDQQEHQTAGLPVYAMAHTWAAVAPPGGLAGSFALAVEYLATLGLLLHLGSLQSPHIFRGGADVMWRSLQFASVRAPSMSGTRHVAARCLCEPSKIRP
ncbi:hypothetical protein cyc_07803 [Cyclospora cayetanensis]|uniref:Uncharacterized protein n=1 Tax=Cyclospora cayetanensis TaxID=88456 RepID=A0A1D3CQY2_9EIME|nr:hypothetical protein cyc_07803 [Cyclospora cayetanensis]